MNHQHDHDDDEITIAIGVQFNEDEAARTIAFGGEELGIWLQLIDQSTIPSSTEDDWDLDPEADYGLRVNINGFDPDTAAQLLRAAADFLDETEWEEVD